ncbi:MAG TPA: alpha/beta fold hydrolase [Conexibacter sp.]|nr:alpha/beta fold hydrolase [Conexibacter sp.]
MRGDRLRRLGVVVAVAAGLLAAAAAAGAAPLGPCSSTAGDRSLCERVTVPLDRTGHVPGTVSLSVRVLPPAHGVPATGTILALAGGPGQAADPLLESFVAVLTPALRTRRLVTFDQRGTGASGQLTCPALAHEGTLSSVVSQCADELGPGRIAYTTAESVADIESVRTSLGIDKLILYGTSYGTKVALDYAAAYPQHVERLVLDSVVAPEGVDPFERTTIASIPRVLRTLCAADCRFTRDPAAELGTLVRRLARAPLRGTALDGSGRPHRVSLTRLDLLGMLLGGDFDEYLRAALPAAVHAALHGDPAPLLRLAAGGGVDVGGAADDSDAVFVATTCEDGGVPWPVGTPPAQRRAAVNAVADALPAATFAPFDRATVRAFGTVDLCRGWPESPIAQPLPALPSTPTLILSGDDDLRTPRADAVALAARLSGAQLLHVPEAGHGALFSDPTDCSQQAVTVFLDGGAAGTCRPHRRLLPPLLLAPERLGDVAPVHGMDRLAGRTVRALVLTLGDATDQVLAELISGGSQHPFGGLRSGSGARSPKGLRLRGYGYVPGVTVTGLIATGAKRVTLRIGGSAAPHGRLTVSRTGIAGVLDGVRVKASARALGWGRARAAAVDIPRLPVPYPRRPH